MEYVYFITGPLENQVIACVLIFKHVRCFEYDLAHINVLAVLASLGLGLRSAFSQGTP